MNIIFKNMTILCEQITKVYQSHLNARRCWKQNGEIHPMYQDRTLVFGHLLIHFAALIFLLIVTLFRSSLSKVKYCQNLLTLNNTISVQLSTKRCSEISNFAGLICTKIGMVGNAFILSVHILKSKSQKFHQMSPWQIMNQSEGKTVKNSEKMVSGNLPHGINSPKHRP